MPVVSVTKRQIKNAKTETDITVPSHQSASSARNVKDYHVVVISKLPHFKKPEHSEDDAVQFMVPRDYNAFEKLQKELLEQFPSLKLPDLPRKHILFMSDEDLEDRRVSFDCLMIIVSRSHELITSIPMLEFLGIDLLADRKYKKRRAEYLEGTGRKGGEEEDEDLFTDKVSSTSTTGSPPPVTEGGSGRSKEESSIFEDDDDSQLFGGEDKTVVPNNTTTNFSTIDKGLFDDDDDDTTNNSSSGIVSRTVKLSLLEDEPELTILKTGNNNGASNDVESDLFTEEDNSELLHVSDTLEDALKVVKDKPKPNKKPKHLTKQNNNNNRPTPTNNKSLANSLFTTTTEEETITGSTALMGTDDITKYIQANEADNSDDDDLQLF